MSNSPDDGTPKPPRPPSVVWAQEYGPQPHQGEKSFEDYMKEFRRQYQTRPRQQIEACEAIATAQADAFKAHQVGEAGKKVGTGDSTCLLLLLRAPVEDSFKAAHERMTMHRSSGQAMSP
eukprot:1139818-Pelagomonas_calceolata.AAC.2